MATWQDVETAVPDLAGRVRARFEARRHHTLATLRRDGAPRISGIEVEFAGGELGLGMMPGSVKAADVGRDPRVAVHSATVDPVDGAESAWPGEAKVSGRAVAQPPRAADGAPMFHLDVTEVVLTRVGEPADHLVIESWHPERGYQRRTRH